MPSDGYLKATEDNNYLIPSEPPVSMGEQSQSAQQTVYSTCNRDKDSMYKDNEDRALTESLLTHVPNTEMCCKNPTDYCCYPGKESELYQTSDTTVCRDEEPEITSDMGHTEMDFEEMMSEMGPPGMLTLIFNNDHICQAHSSLNSGNPEANIANNSHSGCNDDSCASGHQDCDSENPEYTLMMPYGNNPNSSELLTNTQFCSSKDTGNIFIHNDLTDDGNKC